MQTVSTPRSRLARQRRRAGVRCFKIEVEEVALVAYLSSEPLKLIDPNTDDRAAIEKALTKLVGTIIAE